nr:hypothetical protein GCM10020063_014650 [Dactylosporangium thailandense]
MDALDVTAAVRPLADAAALAVRLLTARSPQPVHAAVLLHAAGATLTLTATDGSLTVHLEVDATVHTPGQALISRRGLAETLTALPSPESRLVAEGSRLAVKVPGARFALPILATNAESPATPPPRRATATLGNEPRPPATSAPTPPPTGDSASGGDSAPDSGLASGGGPIAGDGLASGAGSGAGGGRALSGGWASDGGLTSGGGWASDGGRGSGGGLARRGAWSPAPALPAEAGRVDGPSLRAAAAAVAGAASREHALPIFTGVRFRATGETLTLLATDRYRLAVATVSAVSTPFEALIPASLLTRVAPVLGRAGSVALHATGDLFALPWPGGSVVTPTLGDAYPDAQFERLLEVEPECVLELDADSLAAAVERAAGYAGEHGRVTLQSIEGAVLVRAADPLRGESEESVKAAVRSGQATRGYQARLLAEALHAFAGATVTVRIQAALRATELSAPASGLRYLVVPMRAPGQR